MKNILFALALFSSCAAYADEWDLFPLKQKSYFYDTSYWNGNYADLYVMDSVNTTGQGKILYFRKNLELQGVGTCYKDTLESMQPYGYNNFYYLDTLIQKNDTVFYFSDYSNLPFYFLPNAIVGQSWTITSDHSLNNYNQITITCSSIQQETFCGKIDSVKTFTMQPNGISSPQIPVNDFVIKLSKNYGLVEFVPFVLFLYHPNNVNFKSFQLVGIDSLGVKTGYQPPKFENYFHLSIGDILLWQRDVNPFWIQYPPWREYYRDSITQSIITLDSVIYTFNRIKKDDANVISQQNNLTSKFARKRFKNIVETPPNWYGFGNNQFGIYNSTNNVTYWTSSFLYLDIDSIIADTVTSFSFSGYGYSVDTTNCMISQTLDVSYDFTVSTYAGITKYCYNNHGTDCTILIGSKINGQQTGGINLAIDEKEISALTLKTYPNPATTVLNIESRTGNPLEYYLYNITGQIVINDYRENNTGPIKINVAGIPSGIYFLKVYDEEKTAFQKIIVNH